MTSISLRDALQLSSKKVWDEMMPAPKRFAINQVREDGLTSMMLKTLVNTNCNDIVKVIESPKQGPKSEKQLGYDFDLWIGTNNRYVRYIIQAKSQRDNYTLNGEYEIDGTQLSRLETFAARQNRKAIPLYAYYKYLSVPESELQKYFNCHDPFVKESLGITLSSTSKIKPYSSISFIDLHKFSTKVNNWIPLFERHVSDINLYQEILKATVPWHELASLKIDTIDKINNAYKAHEKAGYLGLFLLLPNLLGSGDNLIPIHNMTPDQIVNYCFEQKLEKAGKEFVPNLENFQGRCLMILNVGRDFESVEDSLSKKIDQ